MSTTSLLSDIEQNILQWQETSVVPGDFDARAFLFRKKEFGHLHPNGDLDIIFGKALTKALLQAGLVQQHLYVPESIITYRISGSKEMPFALALLRFSYLIHFTKVYGMDEEVKEEWEKLPRKLVAVKERIE